MRHPISTLRPTAYSASLCALLACLVLVIPALGAAQSNTLSLDQAIALALESHPALTSADYSIAAGVARQDQVESGLRPSVDLTSGWTARVSGSEEFGGAPIEPGRDSSPFSSDLTVGIQARQLLTDFGRTANRMDAARMSTDVSTLDRASLEISIVEDVRLAYFALVAAESLTRVAEDSLERERLRFVQVEAFVNEGIRAPIELAQSRASVASAELSVMEAQGDVDNALLVLADAIGVRPGAFDSVEPGFRAPTSLESMTPDELAAFALEHRPDYAATDLTRARLALEVQTTLLDRRPTLSAVGNANTTYGLFDTVSWSASAGLSFSWSLYSGGGQHARENEATALVGVVEQQLEDQALSIVAAVQRERLTVQTALATLGTLEVLVDAAEQQLMLAEGRYTNGVSNIIEVSDAEQTITQALERRVQAELSLASARARLLAASGVAD